MSSHPAGLRFSPFSTASAQQNNSNTATVKSMQAQPQQSSKTTQLATFKSHAQQQEQQSNTNSLSGSETDISTSTENLSMEERFVLRHTARVEPQGQENLQETVPSIGNENQMRYDNQLRFSSNLSSDSTRYATSSSNRSISESRNPIFVQQQQQQNANNSNRNSLKEANSNRSSMDVSTCSYNTLIIHNDDSVYSINNRDYPSPPPIIKKERPRSYGEQGMQEITEIPDDYLNQSHVLKHLAKEIKIPGNRRSNTRDSGVSENTDPKDQSTSKYRSNWIADDSQLCSKLKSKSQPDLTRLVDIDLDAIEALMKENTLLKHQINTCYMKVAKTQKLEEEVANIYRVHEELVQSCERREKLERAARMRLQSDLQRVQELNRALKDQVDIFQSQLLAPSEHQILIAQLFTQNKELNAAKDRQEIELAAQRATLQEQRNHIKVLDTALINAQHNIRRLEEELRKKQIHIERLAQLQQHAMQSKQNERKLRLEYENELNKDSNRSGSSTNSDTKWQLQDKSSQIMRLENECSKLEQRHLEEAAMRQNVAKAIEKTSQETDRIIAEAKQEKLRYLEEVHSAQRRVNELQTHLKILESRLAEKDAFIRVLQNQKFCGSSFDSYNLSTDSFALNPLSYNSQAFNVSNTSFNTTTNTSLLDPTYGQNSSTNFSPSPSISSTYVTSTGVVNYVGQTAPTYSQNSVNLQSISIPTNYSPNSSNYSTNYDTNNSNSYVQNSSNFDSSYDNQYDAARKSIDEHMKKQLDEQFNKRGLCCFPSLTTKKAIQPLLSDEVSVLSTNNSDAFLQKLAHIDQRERDRQEKREQETQSLSNSTKSEDIVLLEKQGRCSQKMRNNTIGNLVQVSQSVGQNMTDISNIGGGSGTSKVPKIVTNITQNLSNISQTGILPPRKDRGSSLPPSALPRPPRSLKPPRKIEYDRLSDSELKKRAQTPPKLPSSSPQRAFELKTSSLKRGEFGRRDYSPGKTFIEMKETMSFSKPSEYTLSSKNYGTMTKETKFGSFKSPSSSNGNEFSKPDYTSTKNYQRLKESSPKPNKASESLSLKRSLLPSTRKSNVLGTLDAPVVTVNIKTSRDSLNSASSGSNNSNNSNNSRSSPVHIKTDSGASNLTYQLQHAKTPPKYIPLTSRLHTSPSRAIQLSNCQLKAVSPSLPGPSMIHISSSSSNSASLPPKPVDSKSSHQRRGSSLTRGENRYRIQF